jgi:curved DNA-binding protein CbpA
LLLSLRLPGRFNTMRQHDEVTSIDPYEALQVHPKAHPLVVMRAFRVLAAMYHPDNKQTGDREAFERILSAYRLLSDPVRRAAHDRTQGRSASAANGALTAEEHDRGPAPDERRLRLLILTTLYGVRRNDVKSPGLALRVLVDMTDAEFDDVRFSLWYLRGKKLIETGHDDAVAITVAGVDYVEANAGNTAPDLLCLPDGHGVLTETTA